MAVEINPKGDIVQFRFYGELAVADLQEAAKCCEVLDSREPKALVGIALLDGLTGAGLSYEQLSGFVTSTPRLKLRDGARLALVGVGPLGFGLARMFQSFNQRPEAVIACFRSEGKAREWLQGNLPDARASG